MTADTSGNDLNSVKVVATSKIKVAPYDETKSLTADLISKKVADPASTLADIFAQGSFIGLITEDGAPQDARDGDDATEFHQPGYAINGEPTLTLAFTAAEDNEIVREMVLGKPDTDGVYHVADTLQDTKWFAYQETAYKSGLVRRRLGVIQITGNEPDQEKRGDVAGFALTATWQKDATVDGGQSRYLQAYYDPSAADASTASAKTQTSTATSNSKS